MTALIGIILGTTLGIMGRELWPRWRELLMAAVLAADLDADCLVHGRAVLADAARLGDDPGTHRDSYVLGRV